MLPEDVLRDQRLPGLELQRLQDSQADGPTGVHGLPLLVPHSVLLPDCHVRIAASVPGAGEGVRRVRAATELLLQSVPVRYTHETVQEGLRAYMQGDRGVQGD